MAFHTRNSTLSQQCDIFRHLLCCWAASLSASPLCWKVANSAKASGCFAMHCCMSWKGARQSMSTSSSCRPQSSQYLFRTIPVFPAALLARHPAVTLFMHGTVQYLASRQCARHPTLCMAWCRRKQEKAATKLLPQGPLLRSSTQGHASASSICCCILCSSSYSAANSIIFTS